MRVNAVSSYRIDSPLHARLGETDCAALSQRTATKVVVRRIYPLEDAVQAILFVAANPFITVSTVTVDGGRIIAWASDRMRAEHEPA